MKLFCKRFILFVVINLLTTAVMVAQSPILAGKVTNESGESLPGVSVFFKGTSIGTLSDINGNFQIAVPVNGKVLVFSFIGMKTQEISIDGQSVINLVMAEESVGLAEVVAIGYGTQRRVNLTGAVGTVSTEELNSRVNPSTMSLLQGRVAGLQIIQNSANPGAEGHKIQIRGQGTFSSAGSNPLILIDGVEGSLEKLNPNMIENVSVLKDASSAAIYGSRAANGVILITTKGGKEGRMNIDYGYNFSYQNPSIAIDRVTNSVEYMELMNKAIDHSGRKPEWRYTDEQINLYREGALTNPEQYPSSDWTSVLLREAPMHQHFLSINGGNAGTTYNVGLGYLDQTGLMLATDYKRYDAQMNFKTEMGNRVTFGYNITMSKGKRHDSSFMTGSSGNALISSNSSEDQMLAAYAAPPTSAPTLPDGSGRYTAYAFPNKGGNKNPIAMATDGGGKEFNSNYMLLSSYLNIKLLEGLTAYIKGSVRFEEEMAKALVVSSVGYEFHPVNGEHKQVSVWNGGANHIAQQNTRENQYTFFSTLNYSKKFFENHSVQAMAGFQQESFRYDRLDAYRTKLPSKELWEIAAAPTASQTNGSNAYEWAIQSYFGRINYDFLGKYLLEASFRYDGTSRLPKESRWGLFPSISAGWRVSEESFMQRLEFVDNLKFRGSWGQLGNQNIGNYPYQNILSSTEYNFGGVLNQGFYKSALNNSNIKWESTSVLDIGLDFGLINSSIYGSIDWYKKTTSDILRSLQVPAHIGVSAPTINDGVMQNSGWEFVFGYENKVGGLHYNIRGNLETYDNKLVKFGAREISGINIREEGKPWNTYYVLIMDGIYQNQDEIDNGPVPTYSGTIKPKPGDIKYRDISGPDGVPDGKIDVNYDRTYVDGVFPKFSYGLNLSIDYKNFDLSLFAQGVEGSRTMVKEWGVSPFRQASAPPTWWKDKAWDGEGTSNTIPHVFVDEGYTPNNQNSTFWLGNSSYLRLKNIQLGYTIPPLVLKKVGVQNMRLFISGDNLLTFTKFFQGLDPERTSTGSSRAAIYPQSKIYTVGVKITL